MASESAEAGEGGVALVTLADEFGMRTMDAVAVCERLGWTGTSGASVLDPDQAQQFRAAAQAPSPIAPPGAPNPIPYGQPPAWEQPGYGQAPYGHVPYGQQPGWGQPGYGQVPSGHVPDGQQPWWGGPAAGWPPPAPVAPSGGLAQGLKELFIGIALIVGTLVVVAVSGWIFYYPVIAGIYMLIKGIVTMAKGVRR